MYWFVAVEVAGQGVQALAIVVVEAVVLVLMSRRQLFTLTQIKQSPLVQVAQVVPQ
jgi:hypothetical protein